MKNILFLFFIYIMLCNSAYCAVEFIQNLTTICPSSINIESKQNSITSGNINPENGVLSNIYLAFNIKTNGSDENYDIFLQSKVKLNDGSYFDGLFNQNGLNYIILGNTTLENFPTKPSIENIKSSSSIKSQNKNAIAYAINPTTGFSQISYNNNGLKILLGNVQNSDINLQVLPNPKPNTYSVAHDNCGCYEAIITLSALRKP